MLRQGNRSQTKEREDKKQLDIDVKTTVIRFFKNFLEKADKINETYEDMKRDQLKIKNTLSEIKKLYRFLKTEWKIARIKSKIWNTKSQRTLLCRSKKRIQKVEDSVRNLWDNFKRTNIRIMGIPEEEREQDTERILEEIVTENFPHLGKDVLDLQVQEANRTPNKRNPKRTIPRHIIIKIPRAKTKREY